jgi:hypothetical protein
LLVSVVVVVVVLLPPAPMVLLLVAGAAEVELPVEGPSLAEGVLPAAPEAPLEPVAAEVWAMDAPPKASAATAARVVRVFLVAFMVTPERLRRPP